MGYLGGYIGVDLATGLGTNFAPRSLPFGDGSHTNASTRYLWYDGSLVGPFTANIPATRCIGGKRFIQIQEAFTQSIDYSDRLDNIWWNLGSIQGQGIATPNDAAAPGGTSTACRLTTDTTPGITYCRKHADATAGPGVISLFLKQGTQGVNFCLRYKSVGTSSLDITPPSVWTRYQAYDTGDYPVLYNCWGGDAGTGQTAGDNHLLWCVQLEVGGVYAHSPVPNNSGVVVVTAKDQFHWTEAVVDASRPKLRDGFFTRLIMHQASSAQLTLDGGTKYIAHFDATAETVSIYFDGADNKIKWAGSVTGALGESAALTWSLDDIINLWFTFDNGSNSTLKVTGGGVDTTYTGTSTAATDGDLYWGMDTAEANQLDIALISEPEPL